MHLRLAGIYLTLFRPDEAMEHYDKAEQLGAAAQAISFARGVASYYSELDDAIIQYGLSVYYDSVGDKEKAGSVLTLAADHESVWPCVACLAAWNDLEEKRKWRTGNG